MQDGNTVGRMGTDHGQMGHSNLFFRPFLDERHPAQSVVVICPANGDFRQKSVVNFINDLQVSRKHGLENGYRPLLQGFRQQGVIRISKGGLGDFPGLVPVHGLLVHQDPHELGNRKCRMGVVHLDLDMIVKMLQ